MPQTKGTRLNLPRWCSEEMAEVMGLTTHRKDDKVQKIIDKDDPLYCKACDKLFAKDTVFKAHLIGNKHIKALKALKTPFALAEAERLQLKAANKKKYEEKQRNDAEKRKREEAQTAAEKEPVAKKQAVEAAAATEEKKSSVKVASSAAEALLSGQSGEGFSAAIGTSEQEAKSASPRKKVVNKDWWRGTQHATGVKDGGVSEAEEARRGNWNCMSPHCDGHENPKLVLKCLKCGATRRMQQEGYRPELHIVE